MKHFYTIFILFILGHQIVFGQDLHFSQFMNNPLLTNPANTGFIPDADYRIGGTYRNQYSNILANPYKTISLFADAQVMKDRFDNGWLGLGGVILRDEAGSGNLVSTKIYGSVAYHQMLGLSSLLTAGFNLGWANKRIDPTKLTFPDQFNGEFFESSMPSSVILENTAINYFDMQAGLNYAYFPTENSFVNVGYSIHHINSPKETFLADDGTGSNRIPIRHIAFLNGIFKVAPKAIISPGIYFTHQASANEFVAGLNAAYNLSEQGEKQFIAGLYYRVNDAFIPMVGFELNHIRFTFTYDVTASPLSKFNHSAGAPEFNILYKGFYGNPALKQYMCPTF